jgi:hypothetical protein
LKTKDNLKKELGKREERIGEISCLPVMNSPKPLPHRPRIIYDM